MDGSVGLLWCLAVHLTCPSVCPKSTDHTCSSEFAGEVHLITISLLILAGKCFVLNLLVLFFMYRPQTGTKDSRVVT